ncbi:hypothetical protein [Paenibacillus oryzisoli]|uniref:Uncharacterized protein n=1 Tax=Paenibacillus oryzisoli TaxID=1850517 RepID=A0A198A3E9_9BACL|nr:hypothetical protein [Paenibacillus oryzisoli]OAS16009.1 hypothetical protein A8708_05345 [Paenibacillus oryzisoli]
MKQRISYTHLQKLDAQQQNKLRELWEPQEGEYMATGDHEEMIYFLNGVQKKKSLPLLSLGQMMACLSQTGDKFSVNFSENTWEVSLDGRTFLDVELCSALFEALIAKI